MSRDRTITDPTQYRPSEPEYENVKTDQRVDRDARMDAIPNYHYDVKMVINPAYQVTS